MTGSDKPHLPRRRFFRSALQQVITPFVEYFEEPKEADPGRRRHFVFLRPPGAIPEEAFVETCQRCGACVDACPAQAIFPKPGEGGDAGMPVIDPDQAACVVCDGLQCTHVCPSGALTPLTRPEDIRMGLAEVYAGLCVRANGEPCMICVERCPLGAAAIRFEDHGPPVVLSEGCVGCGVCQLYCPTTPKAIAVVPRADA